MVLLSCYIPNYTEGVNTGVALYQDFLTRITHYGIRHKNRKHYGHPVKH